MVKARIIFTERAKRDAAGATGRPGLRGQCGTCNLNPLRSLHASSSTLPLETDVADANIDLLETHRDRSLTAVQLELGVVIACNGKRTGALCAKAEQLGII